VTAAFVVVMFRGHICRIHYITSAGVKWYNIAPDTMLLTDAETERGLAAVKDEISSAFSGVDGTCFDFSAFPSLSLGKSVRARFTLLCCRALGAPPGKAAKIAAAAELAHTASLLHDDCIDEARRRRGTPTVNEVLGVNAAILAGDLVVAMAFELAAQADGALGRELVTAVRRMTEGALLEENSRGRRISPETAERIAVLKTGALFRWCALAACSLSGRVELLETCARLGSETGAAFQLVDDVLDFEGDPEKCGKEVLKDLSEGKLTLPLINTLASAEHGHRASALLERLQDGNSRDLAAAAELAALVTGGGFAAAAREAALARVRGLFEALSSLPDRAAAEDLRNFSLALAGRKA
jgi:octaprenyl-diphosphate synthase